MAEQDDTARAPQPERGGGFTFERYGATRHWKVTDPGGQLVAVVVYRKGAEEVAGRLNGARQGAVRAE
jgi:hypothetical protein